MSVVHFLSTEVILNCQVWLPLCKSFVHLKACIIHSLQEFASSLNCCNKRRCCFTVYTLVRHCSSLDISLPLCSTDRSHFKHGSDSWLLWPLSNWKCSRNMDIILYFYYCQTLHFSLSHFSFNFNLYLHRLLVWSFYCGCTSYTQFTFQNLNIGFCYLNWVPWVIRYSVLVHLSN